ncbi:MAG: hypothetical protein LBE11_05425 [Prevotellaceae bacterium]|jgi:hypothetical protein|nr:hypothetical protein [Prevotellaceae bacterium]
MKSIKLILLITIALYSAIINAQETQKRLGDKPIIDTIGDLSLELPDYYTDKEIISGTGFSFKNIEDSGNYLTIGNINNMKFDINTLANAPNTEDGFPLGPIFLSSLAKFTDVNQVYSSFRDALGVSIINQFKLTHNSASIQPCFIVELNGTVSEVKFIIRKDALTLSIPPEKLYALELLLKQRVNFIIHTRNWMPPFIDRVHISVKIKDL